ncbi:class I SAM-dependent methyltransferase [Kribbella sp. NBC_01245]|uniref:class I SAM-dependent methyltransferase n=1 Tax=Kribbella sp. NBC_01245 TaxID=2903578 RepID=UPI002E29AAA8|nr:class I SAM-dependent methyltransferase [Kribbella sp. NBC_01245]
MTENQQLEPDRERDANRLAAAAREANDPTGWFDRLYVAAGQGEAVVPWDRGGPNPALVEWIEKVRPTGERALVVGTGPGWDAEFVGSLGFETTAFDISPAAIEAVRAAHPDSPVHYQVADLLNPPAEWRQSFDFIVEIYTVQSLPEDLQPAATANVSAQLAPGGSLLVIASARDEPVQPVDGPPWPLSRASVEAFATDGVRQVELERLPHPTAPGSYRWRALFTR